MDKFLNISMFVFFLFALSLSVSAQTNSEIENKIAIRLDKLEKAAFRTGTGDFDTLEKENKALKEELLNYGKRPSIMKYDFPLLADKMSIVTSRDRRFRIYSWDNQQGGSGRIYEVVFQYLDSTGKSRASSYDAGGEGVVCAPYYHQLFQMNMKGGPLYLANSTAVCSGALSGQELSIFRIEGKNLNKNVKLIKAAKGLASSVSFEYDFFSVVDHPERPVKLIFFDEEKRSFKFPVVVEDPKFINGGRVTDKFITYKFNGKYFVKVS